MSKLLRISDTLSLPLDFITQTQAILAIKRVGKSYTASVEAEELLKAGQQIVAIDVTGAWWGLRSNAAGDGPGFPIVIFGGDHGDVPLEESAGEVLAEAIVTERFSAIIDLSLFRKAQAQRFLAVFFETLYRRNREAMHLFMDEADFYAPQKPFGEEARVLGAVNDIVRRGGIRGIGCTLITQRASVLNKDVLTQAGIVTALRVSHPRDMKAILEWVDVHASREDAGEMMKTLPSLPKGDAWVWAPGWPTEGGIFERVTIRKRETFDSGATPKAGHVVKQPKAVAQVDLQKLGEQIASTVQRQKENDPKELKARIRQLEQDLAKKPVGASAPAVNVNAFIKEKIIKGELYTAAALNLALKAQDKKWQASVSTYQRAIGESVRTSAGSLIEAVRQITLVPPEQPTLADMPVLIDHKMPVGQIDVVERGVRHTVHPRPSSPQRPPQSTNGTGQGEKLPIAERKILTALAQYSEGRTKIKVAILTGYAHSGGGYRNALGALRGKGYITGESELRITLLGIEALGAFEPLPVGDELLEYWHSNLPKAERSILHAVASAYPKAISVEDVAASGGYEPTGGGFRNAVGKLRTLELISGKQELKASEALFG